MSYYKSEQLATKSSTKKSAGLKSISKGKKTKAWEKERAGLKKIFNAVGLLRCEFLLDGCWKTWQGFAHTKKRRNIKAEEIRRVVGACNHCHDIVEAMGEKKMEKFIEEVIARRAPAVGRVLDEYIHKYQG